MSFQDLMEDIALGFEFVGVTILVVGSIATLTPFAVAALRGRAGEAYTVARNGLGRVILLGLEILILADIIRTITVDLTLVSAATLGVIVLVRTFLSFSLEIELEGTFPWRRATPNAGTGRAEEDLDRSRT